MKLDRLPEYFITTVVILIGLLLALYIGSQIGSGNTRNVVMVAGGIGFLVAGIIFKRNIWMLIPLFFLWTDRTMQTPFSPMQIAICIAFGWWVIYAAIKKVRISTTVGLVDIVLFINVVYIVFTFIRYPVGVLALGSDRVGGAPYFATAFAVMAYWVLSRVDMDVKFAKWLPWMLVFGTLPGLFFRALVAVIPATAPLANFFVASAGFYEMRGDAPADAGDDPETQRLTAVSKPIHAIMAAVVSKYRVDTFFNPLYYWRCLIMLIAVALVLLSGYRSAFAYLVIQFWVIGIYKASLCKLIRISLIVAPVLGLLVLAQGSLVSLPYSIQRTLSFVPANWDPEPVDAATDSSEWRFEMWRMLMDGNRYLQNRWLGDGFGYSLRDFIAAHNAKLSGDRISGWESFILMGELHSGPFSTIRVSGYVGLFLFYLLLFAAARKAHRLIKRSRNTPFFFPSLVIGTIPVITIFTFTFVYGYYHNDLPKIIVYVGFINLLYNGLILYEKAQKQKESAPQKGSLPSFLRPELS